MRAVPFDDNRLLKAKRPRLNMFMTHTVFDIQTYLGCLHFRDQMTDTTRTRQTRTSPNSHPNRAGTAPTVYTARRRGGAPNRESPTPMRRRTLAACWCRSQSPSASSYRSSSACVNCEMVCRSLSMLLWKSISNSFSLFGRWCLVKICVNGCRVGAARVLDRSFYVSFSSFS